MEFNEKEIKFKKVKDGKGRDVPEGFKKIWDLRKDGDLDLSFANGREFNKPNSLFNQTYIYDNKVCGTLASKEDGKILFNEGKYLSDSERMKIGSYPSDYNFGNLKSHYLIGMSVPPVMTAQIASNIYEQWLSKL